MPTIYHRTLLCLILAFATASSAANGLFGDDVDFDVTPVVPAQSWSIPERITTLPNSRLIAVRFHVSTLVRGGQPIALEELLIRVDTRQSAVQVADYAPRTQMYSSVVEPIVVENVGHENRSAELRGAAGYPGVGWAQGNARFEESDSVLEKYVKLPARQMIAAAGTVDRNTGVYFKLLASPQETLEGSKDFDIVFEVPNHWRAGLMLVSAEAFGRYDARHERTKLASRRFMVALYQEGEVAAGQQAYAYAASENQLRLVADSMASEIDRRKYPTPVHKLGAALDVYEPKIPQTWLDQVIYSRDEAYPTGPLNRLPVDVRVAILDYLEAKRFVEELSSTTSTQATARNTVAGYGRR